MTRMCLDFRGRKLFVGDSEGELFTVNVNNGYRMMEFDYHYESEKKKKRVTITALAYVNPNPNGSGIFFLVYFFKF